MEKSAGEKSVLEKANRKDRQTMFKKRQKPPQEIKNKVGFVREITKNRTAYLMALPGLLALFIFSYLPMAGIIVAFENYSPARGIFASDWVGFKHFINFFNSPYFMRTLTNTLGLSVYSLVFGFPLAIILALLLNELKSEKYKRCVQTITYIPHFVSVVVISGMIIDFCASDGLLNDVLALFGVERSNLLMKPHLFKSIYVWSDIWQGTGWASIVYLAALTGIDGSLYEAAMLDGAGRFKQVIHVTIPGIVPTIVTMLIMRVGAIMSVGADKIILLYNPTTYETAETISSYVYQMGLVNMNFSFSTAVGLFNSVINLILLVATNIISKKTTEVGLW